MDLTEALRIAEKIKPWINSAPEFRAALDALIKAAQNGRGAPRATATPPPPPKADSPFAEFWRDAFGGLGTLAEGLVGMPPEDKPEPTPEPERDPNYPHRTPDEKAVDALYAGYVDGFMAAREYYGTTTEDETVHGAECDDPEHAICQCDESRERGTAYQSARDYYGEPKAPAPPKVGDTVADHKAACKLPLGTMIKAPCGVRGFVTTLASPNSGNVHVDWATPMLMREDERWPATIVLLP